ncbi:DUF2612 domain-containing protein [Robbsia andropogonis]|uniref:DUF2612 domain-containing protein n=1 Tax=Robbsia andropogonis TaxID=28092 RepID=UPI00209F8213|nr:DUF2612 domain-containing protein [Robbsia andropogonis]MCP1120121.1 DUF2612 domain-containing protein [Robbsia andropogonis]MCP1130047.1 DUF2612 domain-containing protein [Robbsia andropogonis]
MAQTSDYTGLITSEHSKRPKFMAMIAAVSQPFVDQQNLLGTVAQLFDLDVAVGAQLDVVGQWVGVSRDVATPLIGVYFAWDTDGVGFDQGVWQGQYDPDSGVVSLDDDTYRLLIRAKIAANRWDGTLAGAIDVLSIIFDGSTLVFIDDHADMSISISISGVLPSAVFLALLKNGLIPLKPSTVWVADYSATSVSGSAIFGFDAENQYVSGFDTGAWAVSL